MKVRVCNLTRTFQIIFGLDASGTSGCQVSDVLVFCTGADRIPPLGFGTNPKIVFLRDGKFATASTCAVELRLPTIHGENLQAFMECMVMSLKGNDGFGGV